jgi:hypothetical protein
MHLPQFAEPSQPETDPKRRYLCRHIFTEGHRCGSPALRGQSLCYYHGRSRREAAMSGHSRIFPMPRIDDRATIQLALYEVLSRLASGDIEYKRGSIILYGLQIASANLPRHAQLKAEPQPQVEEITYDNELGDLAPIAEVPAPAQAPGAPCPTQSTMELQPAETPGAPHLASEMWVPPPPRPITLASVQAVASPQSVILRDAQNLSRCRQTATHAQHPHPVQQRLLQPRTSNLEPSRVPSPTPTLPRVLQWNQ